MSCSNCNNGGSSDCGCSGSSSSCGCGGDCGQPVKIITKQGLKGDKGDPGPANDIWGYYSTSSSSLTLQDLYPGASSGVNITIDTLKAFKTGDTIEIYNDDDHYACVKVASYDSVTGVLNISSGVGADFNKVVGNGTFGSWVIRLISPSEVYQTEQLSLVYEAKKIFSNQVFQYLPIHGEDNANFAAATRMTFNPSDPDVTVIKNIPNSLVSCFGASPGNYDRIISSVDGLSKIKAIEIDLFIPMLATGLDLEGNGWITPKNISGTDVYESGCINVIKVATGNGFGNDPKVLEVFKTNINKRTKTISTTLRINYSDGQLMQAGTSGAIQNELSFYFQNATDLIIKGGLYSIGGSVDSYRSYAIRIYV